MANTPAASKSVARPKKKSWPQQRPMNMTVSKYFMEHNTVECPPAVFLITRNTTILLNCWKNLCAELKADPSKLDIIPLNFIYKKKRFRDGHSMYG
jgi:hypothetical protein